MWRKQRKATNQIIIVEKIFRRKQETGKQESTFQKSKLKKPKIKKAQLKLFDLQSNLMTKMALQVHWLIQTQILQKFVKLEFMLILEFRVLKKRILWDLLHSQRTLMTFLSGKNHILQECALAVKKQNSGI